MRVDMQNLRRSILTIRFEERRGEERIGYHSDGIRHRTRGDLGAYGRGNRAANHEGKLRRRKQVLGELAKRNLIRPLITQGHIGDVLPDKIVFDAQTTSGGSGGPLFNREGKVIGVTYAVLKGFGGSNFGIPIRFIEPLLDDPTTRRNWHFADPVWVTIL